MDNQPQYTIDMSSLVNLFRKEHFYYVRRFTKLWSDIENLFETGLLISHAEVLREIKNNNGTQDELRSWAELHENYFADGYNSEEQNIIGEISLISTGFISKPLKSQYADPWVIAQASTRNLILITEEKPTGPNTQPQNFKIPDICRQLNPKVDFLSLRNLIDKENWTY